jgi:hypothetical protein
MTRRVGFTGTSCGMTEFQREAVAAALREVGDVGEAHHGDCLGADAEFHALCGELGTPVVIHPPSSRASAIARAPGPRSGTGARAAARWSSSGRTARGSRSSRGGEDGRQGQGEEADGAALGGGPAERGNSCTARYARVLWSSPRITWALPPKSNLPNGAQKMKQAPRRRPLLSQVPRAYLPRCTTDT